jgi:poly-beta-hydroxybutyrate-responsive repressor
MSHGTHDEDRHSSLTVSLLEPVLMVLLEEQPRHGYLLLNELSDLGMSTIHPSVVYRTLRELERLDWVVSDWDTGQTQGPPRRIYRLTDYGRAALQYWQRELGKAQGIIDELLKRMNARKES